MRQNRRPLFSLFKRAGRSRRLVLTGLAAVTLCGAVGGVALAGTTDPPSTYAGVRLTIAQAAQYGYNAGFHTEDQLVAVVSIGIAESSLWTKTRNWHPENGYRPASDPIGVPGPAETWNSTHTQQIHSDRGIWQISSRWWPQYSDGQTDDPAQAAAVMWSISNHGTDFTPWDTYKNGAAQQNFASVRPVVQQLLGSAPTTAKPATTTTLKPSTTEKSFTNAYVTSYGWWDNNPPGSAEVCCSSVHDEAAGTGTFTDPLTVAVDFSSGSTLQFAPGTKFYVPNLRAYIVAEDRTGEQQATNTQQHGGSNPHLDVWSDGRTSSASNLANCQSSITDTGLLVIQNPNPNYVVVPGPLASNNTCRATYGNTPVTAGNPPPGSTTTTVKPITTTTAKPVTTTTVKPSTPTTPTTVRVPQPAGRKITTAAAIKYAHAAGFHTEAQLTAVTAIAIDSSSLSMYARRWHREQGYRPASDVIGVRGPSSVWSTDGRRQLHSQRGIWQLSSMWWARYSDARTDDPAKAAAVVWQVTKRGTDFSMFGSYTSGRAQQYYNRPHNGFPAVRPLVQRYLRGFTATAIRR